MLSPTVDYALRVVKLLAVERPASFTAEQIAAQTEIPFDTTTALIQQMVAADLIHAGQAGAAFSLIAKPERLSMLDVVQAVEPIQRIRFCPLGNKSHGARLCAMHRRLDDALAKVEAAFAETSIASVLPDPDSGELPCELGARSTP